MLKRLEIHGFKSFARPTTLVFDTPITAIVGPNGSGKSNIVEAIRFVLGEQSTKSLRGKASTDLLFKGSHDLSKSNRAKVVLVFDNTAQQLRMTTAGNEPVRLHDEVRIGRELIADGTSTYTLNDHEVRLKDIHELIASINIGASGHHIISQGQADRLLNASAQERKTILEESLGLKIFHYRIREAQRKLSQSQSHMHETITVRRELAPHMRFLKKQVEKIQEGERIRAELATEFADYSAHMQGCIMRDIKQTEQKQHEAEEKIHIINSMLTQDTHHRDEYEVLRKEKYACEQALAEHVHLLHHKEQAISRLLGMQEALMRVQHHPNTNHQITTYTYDREQRQAFQAFLDASEALTRDREDNAVWERWNTCRLTCARILKESHDASAPGANSSQDASPSLRELERIQQEYLVLDGELSQLIDQEKILREALHHADMSLKQEEERALEARTSLQKLYEEKNMWTRILDQALHVRMRLDNETKRLQEDHEEVAALIHESCMGEPRESRESLEVILDMRTSLERKKILLESLGGGGGGDIIDEYQEIVARDQFLEKELRDLEQTVHEIHTTIETLTTQLHRDFETGMEAINKTFQEFFALLFDGGTARLLFTKLPVQGEEEGEHEEAPVRPEGVEIQVTLPRKKVSDLAMLSGGERSLTSIALLCALSTVHPPPFLVLDETDAALDESNSRKYGDMIERLSQVSQLIVVTHNRETMSRAHTLYGITLGRDDASALISLLFDEAIRIAK
jgi:chromosome segregation ATPase